MNSQPSVLIKYILSFVVLASAGAFAFWHYSSQEPATTSVAPIETTPAQTTTDVVTTPTTPAQTTTVAPPPAKTTPVATPPAKTTTTRTSTGKYIDGSYTGDAVDVYYGLLQVKAVIRNGQLADVQFLQYPNDRENSVEISNQSLPILRQEAIAAQSAQVDIVSGATETSTGFRTSLASALVQAAS